jgi:hypothetical protein
MLLSDAPLTSSIVSMKITARLRMRSGERN